MAHVIKTSLQQGYQIWQNITHETSLIKSVMTLSPYWEALVHISQGEKSIILCLNLKNRKEKYRLQDDKYSELRKTTALF